MVVVQSAQIPERVEEKTVTKLFQAKDRTKFTNIIGVSLRTIKMFGSRTWLKQQQLSDREKRPSKKTKEDLLKSIIWRMTKVKRLGFVRKCSSLQLV